MAISGDGIVSAPLAHYEQHEPTYSYIQDRLDGTRRAYIDAGVHTRLRLLFDSATYALLTARVPLEQADRAFRVYRNHHPCLVVGDLQSALKDAGVGFWRTKPGYILDNTDLIEDVFVPADRALCEGRTIDAQSILMNARGLGCAKSAFCIAMLGFDDMACLDSNVCKLLDVDPRAYDKSTAEEYQALVDRSFGAMSTLVDRTSTFLAQWCAFDYYRDSVELHDLWFEHVAMLTR